MHWNVHQMSQIGSAQESLPGNVWLRGHTDHCYGPSCLPARLALSPSWKWKFGCPSVCFPPRWLRAPWVRRGKCKETTNAAAILCWPDASVDRRQEFCIHPGPGPLTGASTTQLVLLRGKREQQGDTVRDPC